MGVLDLTTERLITSVFREAVYTGEGSEWIAASTQSLTTNQPLGETYGMLGTMSGWQEVKGPIVSDSLNSWRYSITPKPYYKSLAFHKWDVEYDKFNVLRPQIAEMGSTLSGLQYDMALGVLTGGTAINCFDGTPFFGTAHTWGTPGVANQSNNISINLNQLGAVTLAGSLLVPSPEEARRLLMRCGRTMMQFRDSQGRPMGRGSANYAVVCPMELMEAFALGTSLVQPQGLIPSMDAMSATQLPMSFRVYGSAQLTAADVFYVLRTDGAMKPLAMQEFEELDERFFGPYEFERTNAYHFLATWSGAVAPWDWTKALRVTVTRS